MIAVRRSSIDSSYNISDSCGNHMQYYGYSKREALQKFKRLYGYRYKRGIAIVDYTAPASIKDAFTRKFVEGTILYIDKEE